MKRRPRTTAFYRGRLPHWEVEDGRYFVTMRQAGSLPSHAVEELRAMAAAMDRSKPINAQQHRIFSAMESWLDRAEGHKDLARPDIADMLMDAIAFRQHNRVWDMIEYVIMPNHVHLFFSPLQESLHEILTTFKRWTGGQALGLLSRQTERFWHREWFDHWSRSPEEDERIIGYIRNNPVKAGLVESYALWPYGSWAMLDDK